MDRKTVSCPDLAIISILSQGFHVIPIFEKQMSAPFDSPPEPKYQLPSEEIYTEPQTRTLWVKNSDPTVLSQAMTLQQQRHAHVSEEHLILNIWSVCLPKISCYLI